MFVAGFDKNALLLFKCAIKISNERKLFRSKKTFQKIEPVEKLSNNVVWGNVFGEALTNYRKIH